MYFMSKVFSNIDFLIIRIKVNAYLTCKLIMFLIIMIQTKLKIIIITMYLNFKY